MVLAQRLQALNDTRQKIDMLDTAITHAYAEPVLPAMAMWHHRALSAYTQRIRSVQAQLRQQAVQQQHQADEAQRDLTLALQGQKAIEKLKDKWQTARTQFEWGQEEAMLADITNHKQRISPY